MHPTQLTITRQLAAAFRKARPDLPSGGYVVVADGQASAWMASRDTPKAWKLGCIAVAADGACYLLEGGSNDRGAEKWTLIDAPVPHTA